MAPRFGLEWQQPLQNEPVSGSSLSVSLSLYFSLFNSAFQLNYIYLNFFFYISIVERENKSKNKTKKYAAFYGKNTEGDQLLSAEQNKRYSQ